MVVFPPCKINIGLAIVGKRPDGYHDLETCFYPVPFTDVLEAVPAPDFSFTSSGLPIPGDIENNLVVKAFRLLQKEEGVPAVRMHLHKVVPMGAGLGGGSADGAYALRLLCSVFDLAVSDPQLLDYALRLGSDCPFFLYDTPMMGRGRGDKLTPIDIRLAGMHLVVVALPIHVSTNEAFSGVVPRQPELELQTLLAGDMTAWRNSVINDFEPLVFSRYPEIKNCKEQLYALGARYASMTGSGSAVYGIFDKPVSLKDHFQQATAFAVTIPDQATS
jgi:4-diphosphocytidyl-2-C-methyl-D-erythritol kinase